MIELNVHNITKFYGADMIFKNISFDLKTGDRCGLIGPNGCGKTTLMKIVMGLEDCQKGEISIRKGAKTGYLNQIPEYGDNVKAEEILHMAFDGIYQIRRQLRSLEEQLGILSGDALEKAVAGYGRLSEQYELSGGYEIETRISKITEGLHITQAMKELPFQYLSGGEQTRIILAKILLEEPDVLLLDEPTNHLDLESVEWLESFLKDYKGSVLVVSHDRYFLDSVANRIVELDADCAEIYPGNYSYYVVEKERRFLLEFKNYQNQQKKIDQMEKQIERYRIWGAMRDSDKMYRRAKELEKRLEKIEVIDKPILKKRKLRLNNYETARTGRIVLELKQLTKSFAERKLMEDVNFSLFWQDSACIIGKNGCGKTTFLKMVVGELEPDEGVINLGSQVKIGYLPQIVAFEDEEQTVLEYFAGLHNLTDGEARAQLAKALFIKDDVFKKIRSLSGGEKSRLRLCSLTYEKVNFLILDEPTNHLDIDSREVLEETLAEFDGTLLFVSHDRYFISKIADKIITLEQGRIKVYEGDYSYYLEECRKELMKNRGEPVTDETWNTRKTVHFTMPAGGNLIKVSTGKTEALNKNRKLKNLEEQIEEWEGALRKLMEEMKLHNTEADYLKGLYEEKKQMEDELNRAYGLWEELQLQCSLK